MDYILIEYTIVEIMAIQLMSHYWENSLSQLTVTEIAIVPLYLFSYSLSQLYKSLKFWHSAQYSCDITPYFSFQQLSFYN